MSEVQPTGILLACVLGGAVYSLYEFITIKYVAKETKENMDSILNGNVTFIGLKEIIKAFE